MGHITMAAPALFETTHGALVFAFNFSGQAYDRPVMNRLAAPAVGSGKGLSGLDGAAQAGMVRAEVQRMGRIGEAILVARHAPQSVPCSCRKACCSSYRPNKEWTDAVAIISDHVRATALAGCTTNALLRRAYVVRYFTPKAQRVALEAIADAAEIDRHTVSAHAAKVAAMLGGQKARAGHQAVPGLEEAALQAITDQLREIGMVGDTA